jgi:hypothetical protein
MSALGQLRRIDTAPAVAACPLRPSKRTSRVCLDMSAWCRYCCKSPKLPGDKFPATRRSQRRPPICVASITLPRSPVSLSSGDEVPRIFTRKSRLQPGEFLITSAKRLLQQYLPVGEVQSQGRVVKQGRCERPTALRRNGGKCDLCPSYPPQARHCLRQVGGRRHRLSRIPPHP